MTINIATQERQARRIGRPPKLINPRSVCFYLTDDLSDKAIEMGGSMWLRQTIEREWRKFEQRKAASCMSMP